ncbi:hypothetical protein BP5796_06648 [Coleophoma crateriformis]|uniref:Uncharacterized protein n=1 Tax=Coleophoma crateriformis TaxID=565419 RepID=A0A3D8RP33_9HELO|nr:hypothetical protein BP5796_06648 [Coleophoma crateriformis]
MLFGMATNMQLLRSVPAKHIAIAIVSFIVVSILAVLSIENGFDNQVQLSSHGVYKRDGSSFSVALPSALLTAPNDIPTLADGMIIATKGADTNDKYSEDDTEMEQEIAYQISTALVHPLPALQNCPTVTETWHSTVYAFTSIATSYAAVLTVTTTVYSLHPLPSSDLPPVASSDAKYGFDSQSFPAPAALAPSMPCPGAAFVCLECPGGWFCAPQQIPAQKCPCGYGWACAHCSEGFYCLPSTQITSLGAASARVSRTTLSSASASIVQPGILGASPEITTGGILSSTTLASAGVGLTSTTTTISSPATFVSSKLPSEPVLLSQSSELPTAPLVVPLPSSIALSVLSSTSNNQVAISSPMPLSPFSQLDSLGPTDMIPPTSTPLSSSTRLSLVQQPSSIASLSSAARSLSSLVAQPSSTQLSSNPSFPTAQPGIATQASLVNQPNSIVQPTSAVLLIPSQAISISVTAVSGSLVSMGSGSGIPTSLSQPGTNALPNFATVLAAAQTVASGLASSVAGDVKNVVGNSATAVNQLLDSTTSDISNLSNHVVQAASQLTSNVGKDISGIVAAAANGAGSASFVNSLTNLAQDLSSGVTDIVDGTLTGATNTISNLGGAVGDIVNTVNSDTSQIVSDAVANSEALINTVAAPVANLVSGGSMDPSALTGDVLLNGLNVAVPVVAGTTSLPTSVSNPGSSTDQTAANSFLGALLNGATNTVQSAPNVADANSLLGALISGTNSVSATPSTVLDNSASMGSLLNSLLNTLNGATGITQATGGNPGAADTNSELTSLTGASTGFNIAPSTTSNIAVAADNILNSLLSTANVANADPLSNGNTFGTVPNSAGGISIAPKVSTTANNILNAVGSGNGIIVGLPTGSSMSNTELIDPIAAALPGTPNTVNSLQGTFDTNRGSIIPSSIISAIDMGATSGGAAANMLNLPVNAISNIIQGTANSISNPVPSLGSETQSTPNLRSSANSGTSNNVVQGTASSAANIPNSLLGGTQPATAAAGNFANTIGRTTAAPLNQATVPLGSSTLRGLGNVLQGKRQTRAKRSEKALGDHGVCGLCHDPACTGCAHGIVQA